MICTLPILFSFFITTYAADSAEPLTDATTILTNRTTIKLRFPSDDDRKTTKLFGRVRWSQTIKNSIDDLGTAKRIPVYNVTQPIFKYLSKIMLKNAALLTPLDPTKEEDRKILSSRLLTIPKTISSGELLIQVNYLDPHPQLKDVFIEHYAKMDPDATPIITVDHNKNIIFDNLPHELEPPIAAWLGNYTLKSMKSYMQELSHTGPVSSALRPWTLTDISNSSTDGNCVYIAWQMVTQKVTDSRGNTKNKLYLNSTLYKVDRTKKIVTHHALRCSGNLNNWSRCVLSHNGNYMLLTTASKKQSESDFGCDLEIYDISREEEIVSPIQIHEIDTIKCTNIQGITFDETTDKFHIIQEQGNGPADASRTFDFYTIDLAKPSSFTRTTVKRQIETNAVITWNCVQGMLIGLYNLGQTRGLLYKDGQLLDCVCNKSTGRLKYEHNGTMHDADIDIIQWPTNKQLTPVPHQLSHIPHLNTAIPNLPPQMFDYNSCNDVIVHIDSEHLCLNILQQRNGLSHDIRTRQFVPLEFLKAWKLFHDRMNSGDNKILPDAYFMYLLYRKELASRPDIFNYLSPGIKKIYAITEPVDIDALYAKYIHW